MMRKRGRKSQRWGEIAGWTLGVALVLPSAELAILIPSQWAAPAAWAGLTLALAATVGFFVVKRHSWLLAAPLSFGLASSFALALVNGWDTQVQTALTIAKAGIVIGSLVVFVAMAVLTTRLNHHIRDVTREAGEQIVDEGLFRDDGERIMVYVDRGKLLLRTVLALAALSLFVSAYLWARATVLNQFWQIALGLCIGYVVSFGGLSVLMMFIRMVMTNPTLIINADGIHDNCSLIVTGRGLLRWNETLDLEEHVSSNNPITYHYLDINVTDARAIERRQPLWKRALALDIAGSRQPLGFRILSPLLDRPAAQLVAEINRYTHTHASERSWHKAMTDDEPEQPGED